MRDDWGGTWKCGSGDNQLQLHIGRIKVIGHKYICGPEEGSAGRNTDSAKETWAIGTARVEYFKAGLSRFSSVWPNKKCF